MTIKTMYAVLELLTPLHTSIDEQVHRDPQSPPDAHVVVVTAQQVRDLNSAIRELQIATRGEQHAG